MAGTRPPDPEEVRRQLLALVRKKKKRINAWSQDRPTDWRPGEVYDTEWKVYCTASRAWELILEWLESDRPIETKSMDLPSGKAVWVHIMIERFCEQMVYVKLEILPSGEVLGWSFHISERTTAKD